MRRLHASLWRASCWRPLAIMLHPGQPVVKPWSVKSLRCSGCLRGTLTEIPGQSGSGGGSSATGSTVTGARIPIRLMALSSTLGCISEAPVISNRLRHHRSRGGLRHRRQLTMPVGVRMRFSALPSLVPMQNPSSKRAPNGRSFWLDVCSDIHHTDSLNSAVAGLCRRPVLLS